VSRFRVVGGVAVLAVTLAVAAAVSSTATGSSDFFTPGNLVVSRSVYDNNPANVSVGEQLPPGCSASNCVSAIADGTYPLVFNNDLVDGSFGVTSAIYLDQLTPDGTLVNSLEVPNSSNKGVPSTKDQMVTSFSSKSELALNLSTDDQQISFMGYLAPIDALDVSNSNTPAVIDPTNPVPGATYRVIASVDAHGKLRFTATNAYSGNNGRAAILNSSANAFYTAGNAGNGGSPQPDGVITGAGAQIVPAQTKALVAQKPGDPTPVGSFSITQLGDPADKVGKDTNFRGLTVFDNVVYFTKGSGGNGVNTVYFIDTTGMACPDGVGLPVAGAPLPTMPIAYDPTKLPTEGVTPYNMCILSGFPTKLKSKTSFPFGIWFANADTLYVADEGDGTLANAATSTTAGLQKWVFNGAQWVLAYTLQSGLALGTPYIVPGYPIGTNQATGLPWAPATDGLRNIIGRDNGDGTATIYGITSTVSGGGDQGADPNKLVAVTDQLSDATLSASESFSTIDSAKSGEVLRGVSFTPGT
jgi:hypothetical protein